MMISGDNVVGAYCKDEAKYESTPGNDAKDIGN